MAVCMDTPDYKKEHKHLVKVLLKGSRKEQREEARKQAAEAKKALNGKG